MKYLFSLSLLTLLGCGEIVPADQAAPAPPIVDVPVDAGVDADAAPAPKRVVEQRNPFGQLDPSNLMLDGDFELTGRQGQMPWISFSNEGVLNYETGGLCLSGVRCAKLQRRDMLFGWMAVPKENAPITVRVMARYLPPPGGEAGCPKGQISVYVIDVDSGQGVDTLRLREDIEQERGFCTYQATVTPNLAFRSPGLYIDAEELERNATVLIDRVHATATTVPFTSPLPPSVVQAARPDARAQARIQQVAAWIRARRTQGLAAPSQHTTPPRSPRGQAGTAK